MNTHRTESDVHTTESDVRVLPRRVSPTGVLVVACLGAFLAFLDATIVNVAFPSLQGAFEGSSIGALSWVLNGYNIVFAAFLIVFGRFTDLLGRRRVFVFGVVVFTVASGLCASSSSVAALVVWRVVQALGAAMLVPASLALVVAAFPAGKRAHAIGLWGASAAVAAGLGPPIGGLVIEWGGWQWAFLVNIPFGFLAVVAARKILVESRAPGRRVVPDLAGAVLLAAAMGLFNLGVVKGSDWGWSSPAVLGCLAASALITGGFVVSSRRHREPLLDPALLRIRGFAVSTVATVAAGLGFFAYLLTNILWLQYVWGYTVIQAGAALVPGAVVAAVVAAVLGPLAQRFGYRAFIVAGALVWAGSYLWYHQMTGLAPAFWAEWMPGQVLSGIGVGATLPLLGSAGLAAVPGGRYATASAIASSARQLGGVLGIAVLVVIIGNPTQETAVDAFKRGWVLSIIAFTLVAAITLTLGHIEETDETGESLPGSERSALILEPAPPEDWSPDPQALAARSAFSVLPAEARDKLRESMRRIEVPAGGQLIRQGDPAGPAYLVESGRLRIDVNGTVVRELGPGAVIGELALITGEKRSAGVTAVRDSSVLELTKSTFDLVASDPSANRALMRQLAVRLQTAVASGPRPPQRVSVISVVALTPGASVDTVAAELVEGLAQHRSVAVPGRVDRIGLRAAERDKDRVVLVAGADDEADWREFATRQADVIVLVARVDAIDARLALPSPLARQPELVLVGHPPSHEDRTRWVTSTDAWCLTLVDDNASSGVAMKRLAARLAGRSVGLVLGGGGARGLAHIGVLRELEDCGVHVDRVAGTSIGGILAAMHATGVDGEELEAVAYFEFLRHRLFGDVRLPSHALIAGRRIESELRRAYGRDTVIEGLPRQLSLVSVDLLGHTRQVHRRGNVANAAIASARIPVLMPPVPTDDGRLLVDGGVLDNLPTDLLVERDEGPVVAVNIGTGGSLRSRSGRPRIPAIGDTLVRSMMISSGGTVERARQHGAWVINVAGRGVGLLEFHQMDILVESGRQAARDLLARCGGNLADLGEPVESCE